MSISFYIYVQKQTNDGMLWTWPEACNGKMRPTIVPKFATQEESWAWINSDVAVVPNPNYDPRLDINMANRNARFVLNELGMLPDGGVEECTPITIDVFEAGVKATLAWHEPIYGIPGHVSRGKGPTIIEPGIRDGYANARMEQMLKLVEAAREYGATHIGWG